MQFVLTDLHKEEVKLKIKNFSYKKWAPSLYFMTDLIV